MLLVIYRMLLCFREREEQLGFHSTVGGARGRRPSSPRYQSAGFGSVSGWGSGASSGRTGGAIASAGDDCAVAEWSQWSPCSHRCGNGSKARLMKLLLLLLYLS